MGFYRLSILLCVVVFIVFTADNVNKTNIERFVFYRSYPNLDKLPAVFPNNLFILPLTANTSVRWGIYRLYGVNIDILGGKTNFVHLKTNLGKIREKLAGLHVSPSFLMISSDSELQELIKLKREMNIPLYMDLIPKNSQYNFNRNIDDVPFINYVDFFFGPILDNQPVDVKHLDKRHILKHFGFSSLSQDAVSGSHEVVPEIDRSTYNKVTENELAKYIMNGACKNVSGVMLGHLKIRDEESMLSEDGTVVSKLRNIGCEIYTDAINMAEVWHTLKADERVILLITEYERITSLYDRL